MGLAHHIQPGHLDGHARAEARVADRIGQFRRVPAEPSELRAAAEPKRPAPGLLDLDQHVFRLFDPARVLQRHFDLGEHAEVVEVALRREHAGLRQRLSGGQLDLPRQDFVPGLLGAGQDCAAGLPRFAVSDVVVHDRLAGRVARFRAPVEGDILMARAEVLPQDALAVRGDAGLAERLARGRGEFEHRFIGRKL